jgi:hypothetical protein
VDQGGNSVSMLLINTRQIVMHHGRALVHSFSYSDTRCPAGSRCGAIGHGQESHQQRLPLWIDDLDSPSCPSTHKFTRNPCSPKSSREAGPYLCAHQLLQDWFLPPACSSSKQISHVEGRRWTSPGENLETDLWAFILQASEASASWKESLV